MARPEKIDTDSSFADKQPEEPGTAGDPFIQLLDEWMADESGYDEETWPLIKERLQENRRITSQRLLFGDDQDHPR